MPGTRPKAGKPLVHSGRGGLRGFQWIREHQPKNHSHDAGRAIIEWAVVVFALALMTVLVYFKR